MFPAIAIVAACCLAPLLWIAGAIAAHPSVIADVQLSSFRAGMLGRTLLYNGSATLLATAMGFPVGLVLGRGRGRVARALWLIVPAALFMPSLAYAYGWAQFVRLAEPVFHPLGITFLPTGPADVARCVWTLAAWLWAAPACIIGLALRQMDHALQQAALLDGGLLRITTRQLAGPIVASLAIVLILASQEFSVYEPTGISVVATEMRMVFDSGAFSSLANPITASLGAGSGGAFEASTGQRARAASAVATAVPMLLITAALAFSGAWGAGRFSATDTVVETDALGAASWPRALDAPRWTLVASIALLLINVGVPVVALFAALKVSFSPWRILREFGPPVNGSLVVGLAAAALAGIAALSASTRWPRGALVIAGASFLIGGQLMAIAMIRICNRPGLGWAYDYWPLPAMAYIGRFGWIALAAAHTTWGRPWRELRDMASLDGASRFQSALRVVWPLAWPTLAAGCLLVGVLSLTEVPATVLISPQNPQVLTPTLMTWVHVSRSDPMIEASLLMMFMVLIPVALAATLASVARRMRPRART